MGYKQSAYYKLVLLLRGYRESGAHKDSWNQKSKDMGPVLDHLLNELVRAACMRDPFNLPYAGLKQGTANAANKAAIEYWAAIPREERQQHFNELLQQTKVALV